MNVIYIYIYILAIFMCTMRTHWSSLGQLCFLDLNPSQFCSRFDPMFQGLTRPLVRGQRGHHGVAGHVCLQNGPDPLQMAEIWLIGSLQYQVWCFLHGDITRFHGQVNIKDGVTQFLQTTSQKIPGNNFKPGCARLLHKKSIKLSIELPWIIPWSRLCWKKSNATPQRMPFYTTALLNFREILIGTKTVEKNVLFFAPNLRNIGATWTQLNAIWTQFERNLNAIWTQWENLRPFCIVLRPFTDSKRCEILCKNAVLIKLSQILDILGNLWFRTWIFTSSILWDV